MRIYKSREEIAIPTDLNLTELLHTSAHGDLPESHLVAKDSLTNRSITIGQLRERAGRIAKGLRDGLAPADQARWVVVLPNSVDFLELVHAILWTGGVACPVNHALKAAEIGHGIAVARPDFVVAYGPVVPAVRAAVAVAAEKLAAQGVAWTTPEILTVVSRAAPEPDSHHHHHHHRHRHVPDDFLAAERLPVPHHADTRTRLATIHLSSGTTGEPKGVELTHHNFVANCHQLLARDRAVFAPDARCVAFTPWAHIANTTVPLFLGPWAGMLHHAMPAYRFAEYVALVGSNRATVFQGVPSVVLQIANSDDDDNDNDNDDGNGNDTALARTRAAFSCARVLNVGGALKPELLARVLDKAPWRLNQVYGMTEAAGYVAYQSSGEAVAEGATGRLLPGIEACLKREGTGEDAPEGGPGELWLRGPNIARGYAFNAEADARGYPLPGWYNTGDVCTVDAATGAVSVVGRTKDLIKYKGFQIAPAELEAHLNAHPHVLEAGVGATWDEGRLTELPTAWVVLRDRLAAAPAARRARALRDVHRDVDRDVSGYKKLRGGVWQVARLPKNPTGKILRKQLVEMRDGLCSLDAEASAKL
ncbi:putative AMP-binding enzyme [Rosellinia necatrix]|uniref:Putative AMP-binding enzyme n=1 Tax=Rosellinia necatrix TaxID=77044 RepID=A0A1W2TBI4_ROSNE|nr:putative AMP-binding enzyme [Rosellinia necatrix]